MSVAAFFFSGATGAAGGVDDSLAVWFNLTLSGSGNVSSVVQPACYPDAEGQVYVRGRVSISWVPESGPVVVAVLPCPCTPGRDVIVTTTSGELTG